MPKSSLPRIVIDGRNSARSKYGRPDRTHVLLAASYFFERGFSVIVVKPHWAGKELIAEIRKVAKIQSADISNEPGFDDKIALALCIVEDGYYVSNDKHMHKHLKGALVDRPWCSSRRIGFHIDEEGNFIPHYPKSWHSNVEIAETGIGATKNGKEVRE